MAWSRPPVPLWIRHAIAVIGLVCALPGHAAQADEALLVIEDAQARYEAMQESVQVAAGLLSVLYDERQDVPQTIALADAQARQAFDVPGALQAMRQALAATPPVPQASALPRIAQDMAQRQAQMRAIPQDALAREGEALARRMAERPDAEVIEALLPLMAEPALAGENALAAERLYRLMEMLVVEGRETAQAEIALLGEDTLRQELIHVTRAASPAHRALRQEWDVQRQIALMHQRYVLSFLPPEDVLTLREFYTSPAGRAKRDALVRAFAARNDTDSLRAIQGVLAAP